MTKRSHLVLLLAALAVAVGLAACGEDTPSTSRPEGDAPTATSAPPTPVPSPDASTSDGAPDVSPGLSLAQAILGVDLVPSDTALELDLFPPKDDALAVDLVPPP